MMEKGTKIIGAAFGDPQSELVFSGVPKYLFRALEKRGVDIKYASTKQLRFWDLINGALDFSKIFQYGKPGLNVSWLWRKSTIDKFTKRFYKALKAFNGFDVVLQIGTHVKIDSNQIKHFCFTDMTVAQVAKSQNAKEFSAGKLKYSQVLEAIEAQKGIFQSCNAIFVSSN